MNRKIINIAVVATLLLTFQSCAELTNILLSNSSEMTKTVKPKSVITDIINAVMGNKLLTEESMYGQWGYAGTSVAFETENLWKQAGGKVAAYQVESKLDNTVRQIGLESKNTYFVFNKDKTYKAVIRGIPLSGQYSLDPKTKKVRLSYLMGFGSLNTTIVLAGNNMKIMFDADSILKVVKMAGQVTGDSSLKALGDVAEMYDGMLLGFDLNR